MREHSENLPVDLYRQMLRIRLFEQALIDPILSSEVKTPCHLCIGQEAVAVGVCSALRPQDQVFGNHRSHGHYLARGGDMNKLAAEIWGKETGCSKGRGGSMHIAAPEVGFMGATPIVAGTVSLALGTALAAKIKGEDRIVVSFFGDGAMGEGVVYEAVNFAVLHELPIIFVCENNGCSTHMPIEKCAANVTLSDQVSGFGIHRDLIDGNDVMEVKTRMDLIVKHKRLPYFLECETYRLCGHVGPDDNILGEHLDIRPKEEIEEWKMKDPLRSDITTFMAAGILFDEEITKEVQAAIEFARSSPWPNKEDLLRDVYA